MRDEFEFIQHGPVQNIKAFLVEMYYRRPHLHADIELIYVVSGSLKVKFLQNQVFVTKGELLMINACQLHELISEKGAQLLIIQFGPTCFSEVYPAFGQSIYANQPVAPRKSSLLRYLYQAALAYFQEGTTQPLRCFGYSALMLHDLLTLVSYQQLDSGELSRSLLRQDRIRRVIDYLHHHIHEKIQLQDLAQRENLSTSYLSHFIKDTFGVSFQEYLNILRCEKALMLLQEKTHNLLEISENCGFSHLRYFNQAFKKYYGVTPKEYRQQQGVPVTSQSIATKTMERQQVWSQEASIAKLTSYLTSLNSL